MDITIHREESLKVIAEGSKSFATANRLFSPETSGDVAILYRWCRYIDDEIDGQSLGQGGRNKTSEANTLEDQTIQALETNQRVPEVFEGLRYVCNRYNIPTYYPLELIEGMRSDEQKRPIDGLDDLYLYCYQVASVVGLMMCHILGVQGPSALAHASSMGLAMQLTNIARDIEEDTLIGRWYLPWAQSTNSNTIYQYKLRLLALADQAYEFGNAGIVQLPRGAQLAIASASQIYRNIGREIALHGVSGVGTRHSTSKLEKLWIVFQKLFSIRRVTIGDSRNYPTFTRQEFIKCVHTDILGSYAPSSDVACANL